jgi:hypothetical protein
MRGTDSKQATMLSLLSPEKRVPAKHPLRAVKALADAALAEPAAQQPTDEAAPDWKRGQH